MKTITLLFLSIALIFSACKQKEVDCSTNAYKSPCYIAFKGFPESSLHTIVRNTYRKGTSFTEVLQRDTFLFPTIALSFDTAFSSPNRAHMGVLNANCDYEITLPDAARTFQITAPVYTADTITYWTAKKTCGTPHTFTVYPELIKVDNTAFYTTELSFDNHTRWIVLR